MNILNFKGYLIRNSTESRIMVGTRSKLITGYPITQLPKAAHAVTIPCCNYFNGDHYGWINGFDFNGD